MTGQASGGGPPEQGLFQAQGRASDGLGRDSMHSKALLRLRPWGTLGTGPSPAPATLRLPSSQKMTKSCHHVISKQHLTHQRINRIHGTTLNEIWSLR